MDNLDRQIVNQSLFPERQRDGPKSGQAEEITIETLLG